MSADERAIRVEQVAQSLSALAVDISAMVRDAYAEGLRDGLNRARALRDERAAESAVDVDLDDVAQRRPTTV